MKSRHEGSRSFPCVTLEVPRGDADLLHCILLEEGGLGSETVAEDAAGITCKCYFEDRRSMKRCLRRLRRETPNAVAGPAGTVDIEDWISLLHGGFEPVAVGPLLIVPAQAEAPPGGSATLLRINPGLGFGTGSHPTTWLCLQFLCDVLRPGDSVFDLGAGSGILAIAALLLGAREALAVDIDADAVANAVENAALNDVSDGMDIRVGSLEQAAGRAFDLVLANILLSPLVRLLEGGLADLPAPGGRLVISGFALEDGQRMRWAVERAGLAVAEERSAGAWGAFLATHPKA